MIKVFLFRNEHVPSWSLLKARFRSLRPPLEQIGIPIVPILHHRFGKMTSDDVILVFYIKGTHDRLQFFCKLETFKLRWVVKTVHHVGDATVLQCLSDCFPPILDKLGSITWRDAILNHFVKAQYCACLQHSAQNCLFSHEVALDLGNE